MLQQVSVGQLLGGNRMWYGLNHVQMESNTLKYTLGWNLPKFILWGILKNLGFFKKKPRFFSLTQKI